jgi:hypothetical protein
MSAIVKEAAGLLRAALASRVNRADTIKSFQELVWSSTHLPSGASEVLADLAFDLDYYEADPKRRQEDPSYYGDDRAETEIEAALTRLAELGLA